jgi:tRNA (mo5U34)-methyltransferase
MNDVAARVAELAPWFHDMDLGGVRTGSPAFLWDYPASKLRRIAHALPDVTGLTVLDIGCNAGYWSIAMKQRGAARVLGIDSDPRYLAQAKLAAEVQGADIELRQLDVYDVAALGERFDLVIFTGVLYHLRHPLLALDLIHAHVARDWLLFQCLQHGAAPPAKPAPDYPFDERAQFDAPGWPKLHFVEHRFADDPTNWWLPNLAAAEAMLRSAGFTIQAHPEADVHLCRRAEGGHAPIHPATGPAR